MNTPRYLPIIHSLRTVKAETLVFFFVDHPKAEHQFLKGRFDVKYPNAVVNLNLSRPMHLRNLY